LPLHTTAFSRLNWQWQLGQAHWIMSLMAASSLSYFYAQSGGRSKMGFRIQFG
jgi:hypothetical protein